MKRIPIPKRDLPVWQGIKHSALVDAIVDEAYKMGFIVADDHWMVNRTGTDLWGTIDFAAAPIESNVQSLPEGLMLSLGVRHSNVGRRALQFAMGARVMVCSNGLFVGDYVLSRKHTKNVDLHALIRGGLQRYVKHVVADVNHLYRELTNWEITDRYASYLIIKAAREDVIPWRLVKEISEGWYQPASQEFEQRTEWSLFNSFTSAAKKLPLAGQYKMHSELESLFRVCRNWYAGSTASSAESIALR